MEVKELLNDLTQYGLVLGLSEDRERISVDQTNAKLTEEQKTLIRDHKPEIMDFLVKRDLNPKVIKGAIHWIAHRSQRYLDKLTPQERSTLMDSLSEYRRLILKLYEDLVDLSKQPYTSNNQHSERYSQILNNLVNSMKSYYRVVLESVSCAMKGKPMRIP